MKKLLWLPVGDCNTVCGLGKNDGDCCGKDGVSDLEGGACSVCNGKDSLDPPGCDTLEVISCNLLLPDWLKRNFTIFAPGFATDTRAAGVESLR